MLLPFDECSMPAGNCREVLNRMRVGGNDRLLVTGLGPVGEHLSYHMPVRTSFQLVLVAAHIMMHCMAGSCEDATD